MGIVRCFGFRWIWRAGPAGRRMSGSMNRPSHRGQAGRLSSQSVGRLVGLILSLVRHIPLAHLLHASFRPSLATTAILTSIRLERDFHPQVNEHARHTLIYDAAAAAKNEKLLAVVGSLTNHLISPIRTQCGPRMSTMPVSATTKNIASGSSLVPVHLFTVDFPLRWV
jgi:hypothetical protein